MSTARHLPRTVEALLADGTTVEIRPLGPSDRAAVLDLHAVRMSDESRRLRFFGASRSAPQLAVDRLCAEPRPELLALGAWAGGELVGEADCETVQARPDTAELAVAVADDWHHRGVATLLLEHLIHAARENGIRTIEADTLAGNLAVHRVFSDLGLPVHRHLEQGEVRVRVPLDETDEHYRAAVDERGRSADVASLAALLRPASVAVVGASRRPGSVGQSVLLKIRQDGFTGELWAVNPYAAEVAGEPAYPSLSTLPGTPDLAVLAVPPIAVAGAAEECGQAGVRALVVLTSGLGVDTARQLIHACRRHSMRLVGPNSLGIAQTDPEIRLDAEFGAVSPLPGSAGVAVQSGGVGIALLERLTWLGIGVSSFVSLGDKYDVSGNDLLQWWESDGTTDVALLHLESFGNPRAFSRTARRVTRKLPIITVDAGRSPAGRRGAASHTAAAATPTVTRETLFRQAGITATHSLSELVDTATLLHSQPLPSARCAVAVVSNAGGVGILAADACADAGLTQPELPCDLTAELRDLLPGGASTANPVDTTAAVRPGQLAACIDTLARSRAVDALLVCLVPTALCAGPQDDPVRALLDGPARRRIPVAAVLLSQEVPVRYLTCADGGYIPSYADPQAAARALGHARDRARWLAEPPSPEAKIPPGCDPQAARRLAEAFLAANPDGGWLDPALTVELFDCYGLSLTVSIWAPDERGAVIAAQSLRQLGHRGEVALKAYWPGQVHKSALGAVRTGLATDSQVHDVFREFTKRFGRQLTGVVVQPMAAPGLELLAGVVQDRVFGPLVVLGLGGTASEVLDDRTARLAPLTERDLATMATELRSSPLLSGRQGAAAIDLAAVQDVLAKLSRLAADLPQLAELDLNPLIARPDGVICVDARVRLEPRPSFEPYLRRLRRPAATEEP
ncbi:bifunctional GNAT family N-acetyltransferase/acetate--CoA ligase family protein [Kitasatospora sp. GP82]|uniref:bifunctional acetate--CoA ligase family protein/GNAT family N-acetyltransferase n=1 Tax=Kitasatospora sp. GP82 TaxID=3035089 RepID=UPI002477238A|nr:bifunctional GNAT family N-acetyltransferase/acetate--CoA ligase family protein [Kitasatospora sp. GP82]MDH6127306.1 acyl-CoA synthetase (NDP forming)/GNAT superfamily N-acetyltransferase [Kitasatospora sp. GP82]